jgi:hypothetical protein
MVETDHAFDKDKHVGTDRGVVDPGVSPETLVGARLQTIGASSGGPSLRTEPRCVVFARGRQPLAMIGLAS